MNHKTSYNSTLILAIERNNEYRKQARVEYYVSNFISFLT